MGGIFPILRGGGEIPHARRKSAKGGGGKVDLVRKCVVVLLGG